MSVDDFVNNFWRRKVFVVLTVFITTTIVTSFVYFYNQALPKSNEHRFVGIVAIKEDPYGFLSRDQLKPGYEILEVNKTKDTIRSLVNSYSDKLVIIYYRDEGVTYAKVEMSGSDSESTYKDFIYFIEQLNARILDVEKKKALSIIDSLEVKENMVAKKLFEFETTKLMLIGNNIPTFVEVTEKPVYEVAINQEKAKKEKKTRTIISLGIFIGIITASLLVFLETAYIQSKQLDKK